MHKVAELWHETLSKPQHMSVLYVVKQKNEIDGQHSILRKFPLKIHIMFKNLHINLETTLLP